MVNRDFVQFVQAFVLRKPVPDELGIVAFEVCQYEQLFSGGIIPEVAREIGVLGFPLAGGDAEKRKVEQIGFRGVHDAFLSSDRKTRRNEMYFHSVGMDAVIDVGQGAMKVPVEFVAAFEGFGFF